MQNKTTRQVQTPSGTIDYVLVRKRVKNINLRVRSDGSILVSAGQSVSANRIDDFVNEKHQFVFRALAKFRQQAENTPKPKSYESGECFYILGKAHTLNVILAAKNAVVIGDDLLNLYVKDTNDFALKERVLKAYFHKECLAIFSEMIAEIYPLFIPYNVKMPTLRMREMKSRWGSCMPTKGIITLNKKLLFVPKSCIAYVVVHEFCHFIHPNHSKAFYQLVANIMPDWQAQKQKLSEFHRII